MILSSIIDTADARIRNCFDDNEWAEIVDFEKLPQPDNAFVEFVKSFTSDSIAELRAKLWKQVMKKYDPYEDYGFEWANIALRNLCRIWETENLESLANNGEHWYTINVFTDLVDKCLWTPNLNLRMKR